MASEAVDDESGARLIITISFVITEPRGDVNVRLLSSETNSFHSQFDS